MGIFSPDVWTHCNYIAETFRDMFLTHCDTSVPTFTILRRARLRPAGHASQKWAHVSRLYIRILVLSWMSAQCRH